MKSSCETPRIECAFEWKQISTDDFWETSTQRIDPFDGDLFGNYDDAIDIFGEEPFLDEEGNVIPTTIPPVDCGESGNCFDGFGESGFGSDYEEEDYQVSLSVCFSIDSTHSDIICGYKKIRSNF